MSPAPASLSPVPEPTADGSDTLYSPAYGQTYHSRHGALTESRHVFLDGSGVQERLAQSQPTRVLEVGFGTGLNTLLTAHAAARTGAPLHYVALEQDVLPASILGSLNHAGLLPGMQPLHDLLMTWRRRLPHPPLPGCYPLSFSGRHRLELLVGDARTVVLPLLTYHAIYLDAFSPETNPALWTESFLRRLFEVTRPGGMLATYSAKGTVRRALQAVGYRVAKKPAPPGKREMTVAVR